MTREEAKKLMPIIQAFVDGKIIQTKNSGVWTDVTDKKVNFDLPSPFYRIKPEPNCRPFKTKEECWKEMHNHSDFGWLMKKDDGELTFIYGIYNCGGNVMVKFGNDPIYNLNVVAVFYIYNFADGMPFGIMEE